MQDALRKSGLFFRGMSHPLVLRFSVFRDLTTFYFVLQRPRGHIFIAKKCQDSHSHPGSSPASSHLDGAFVHVFCFLHHSVLFVRASNDFISQSLRLSLNFTGIDKERMPMGYRDTASPGPNLKITSLEEVTSHPLVLRFLLLSPVDGGG